MARLVRRAFFLILAALATPALQLAPLQAQSGIGVSFEAASIKKNVSGDRGSTVNAAPGGRITAVNTTIRELVRVVYRVPEAQIVGAPDWWLSERWDILATAGADVSRETLLDMMKSLLVDRLKLVAHKENREAPLYALVLARSDRRLGPKLSPDTVDCARMTPGSGSCGTDRGPGFLTTIGTSMAQNATTFARIVGRPVIDETSLAGQFRFELRWSQEPSSAADAPIASDAPSFFTAIQEQLGLKLESRKAPVEFLIIDSVEHPAED